MPIMYVRCAGLDVHKQSVVACVLTRAGQETRTCGTMTAELLTLADWLLAWDGTHVALERTGDAWKPVCNMLEGTFEVLLVHAQHVKAVPGRQTDVKDAAWLAELLPHGLLRPSGMPPVAQRELRDLTRYRSTLIQERVSLIHRVQKRWEDAIITLAAVASDSMGASGRAILAALLTGPSAPQALAELATGRLRRQRDQLAKALAGRVTPPHRVVLTALLSQLDRLEETIARGEARIQAIYGPIEEAVELLATMPGVARHTAEMIVAEIGIEMTRVPGADHLASWAGVAPGNPERAGKRMSGKTRRGHRFLRTTLVRAAHAAARPRNNSLSAQYRRLAARRSKKRAILAEAHSMLVLASYMIQRRKPYREAGADFFARLQPVDTARRFIKRLESLGYQVTRRNPSTDTVTST